MKPKVSIITGVYNAEKFIKATIESVLAQTFTNFEWILINDGSTDGSLNLLNEIDDKRVKIIDQANTGLTLTLNKGLILSCGEYIARIDADDLWHKSKLEKQVNFLKDNPEHGLIACNYEQLSETGIKLGRRHCPFIKEHKDICKAFIKYNPFAHSSVMFRRSIFEVLGGYNTEFKYTQDYEYWVRIASTYRLASLNEILMYHRLSSQSISFLKLSEQRRYALKAKLLAYNSFDHSFWDLRYILKDFFVSNIPQALLKLIKK